MIAIRPALAAVALALLAAGGSSPAAAGEGPSFNCVGVKRWVERTICGDPALAEKDLAMSRAYSSFVDQYVEGGGEGTDISPIVREQRAWIAKRNQCRTRSCLHRVYDERIAALDVDY